MNIFMGYNFFADGNSLDPYLTTVDNINDIKLQNGKYDHINATNDISTEYSTEIPTVWDNYTIMDCDFNGNISGGSLNNITAGVTSIKIKRREINSYNWITIKELPVNSPNDFSFVFDDFLGKNNTTYEYAFVPVVGTTEGTYLTEQVLSHFNGVFICDANSAYKFMSGVAYGTTTTAQKIGVFEPFGKQYPVIVANSITSYDTGSIEGNILPPSFETTRDIVREDVVRERMLIKSFLTNKKAKILKDWNGNYFLLIITGSPTTTYDNNFGMGFVKVGATWTEIGNGDSASDMYHAGLVPSES